MNVPTWDATLFDVAVMTAVMVMAYKAGRNAEARRAARTLWMGVVLGAVAHRLKPGGSADLVLIRDSAEQVTLLVRGDEDFVEQFNLTDGGPR